MKTRLSTSIAATASCLVAGMVLAQTPAQPKPQTDDEKLKVAIEAVNRAVENRKKAEADAAAQAKSDGDKKKIVDAAAKHFDDAKKAADDKKSSDAAKYLQEAQARLAPITPPAPKPTPNPATQPKSPSSVGPGTAPPPVPLPRQPATPGTPPRTPDPGTASPAVAVKPGGESATNPPGKADKTAPAPQDMRITCNGPLVFDKATNIVIYVIDVFANRTDLKIWCDALEVSMNQEPKTQPDSVKAVPGKDDKNKPKEKVGADAGGGMGADSIRAAIAKSKEHLVVIWRKTEQGEMVANAREAYYDGATGDIILKGRSEVISELKKQSVGKDDSAVLTLKKNGDVGGVGLETAYVQEPAGREILRRLLSNAPNGAALKLINSEPAPPAHKTKPAAPVIPATSAPK